MVPPAAWWEQTQKYFGGHCRYLKMARILDDMNELFKIFVFKNRRRLKKNKGIP